MELLKEVLQKIKPNSNKIQEAEETIKKINSEAKKQKINAKAVFGGSYAKNTWLKEDADVDIFVKFNMKYVHEDLSSLLGKILEKFKKVCVHGSRDYYQIKNKIKFEIIPVLDIKKPEQAHNVTDFSPFHVEWVKKSKLNEEIRISKKFFKANGVYGAESYIQGFSGHVVDILTIYYGGFLKLAKEIAKWKKQTIIDPEKKYKNKNPLFILNKSKIQGPLIVIDPVQPDRNASSVVSQEKYEKLIQACKAFNKKPSAKFFEEQKKDFSKSKGFLTTLEITPLEGKRDVVGSKILKVFEFLKEKLNEFELIDSGWEWDEKAKFFFVTKKDKLSDEFIREGPNLELKEHVAHFKELHEDTFVEKNRIHARIKREHTKLEEVANELIKENYVKERILKIKIL
ncbi:nucleotidyltransferase domain-containing protein [Candidatus Woesearchaeota archaeon]|nr:nucleotidyltransferase domain-containing protein [Candidatus Woesearchaeota archaeon]